MAQSKIRIIMPQIGLGHIRVVIPNPSNIPTLILSLSLQSNNTTHLYSFFLRTQLPILFTCQTTRFYHFRFRSSLSFNQEYQTIIGSYCSWYSLFKKASGSVSRSRLRLWSSGFTDPRKKNRHFRLQDLRFRVGVMCFDFCLLCQDLWWTCDVFKLKKKIVTKLNNLRSLVYFC